MLAVAVGSNSEYCYSGGADARIHSWKIPDLNMDPYDGYGETAPSPCLPSPTCCPLGPLGPLSMNRRPPPRPHTAGAGAGWMTRHPA